MQFSGLDPRKAALEKLIEDLLIAREAARRGIGITPEEVDAAICRDCRQNRPEAYQLWLAENGYRGDLSRCRCCGVARHACAGKMTADVGDSAEFVRARVIKRTAPKMPLKSSFSYRAVVTL